MPVTQRYKLNIVPEGTPVVVHASQYDAQSRDFYFTIYNGSELFEIPSGSAVTVRGTKPDKTGFEYSATYNGSLVHVIVEAQMTVLPGNVRSEIRITNGAQILGTANFILRVESAGLSDETQISETDLPLIEKAAAAGALASQVGNNTSAINTLSARMDEFTRLPDGSTTGDAELADIRIWYDGKESQTAGDAVRGQASLLDELYSRTNQLVFDKSIAVDRGEVGKRLVSGTGVLANYSSKGSFVSQLLRVVPGDEIEYKLNGHVPYYAVLCSYDANGTFKRSVPAGASLDEMVEGTFSIAGDERFVRFYVNTYSHLEEKYIRYNGEPVKLENLKNFIIEKYENNLSVANEYIFDVDLLNDYTMKRLDNQGQMVDTTSKLRVTDFYAVNAGDTLEYSLSSTENYPLVCVYDENKNFIKTVAVAEGYTRLTTGTYTFEDGECFVRASGTIEYSTGYKLVYNKIPKKVEDLAAEILTQKTNAIREANSWNIFKDTLVYSHLLIDKIDGNNVIIPSESIYNLQMDARLGFKFSEGNVHETSDGKFVVMHGVANALGKQVEHVDGTTDISNVKFADVTLDWLNQNVRYKSIYPKYRTPIVTLEEWANECRRLGITPVVTASNQRMNKRIIELFGKNQYVGYNSARTYTDGYIMTFKTTFTTLSQIQEYLQSVNMTPPFIMCLGKTADITDSELSTIVDWLHAEGYLVGMCGCYYGEAEWQRCLKFNFDVNVSGWTVPKFENGNICNLDSGIDFADFTTDGTVNNATLTLNSDNTIEPSFELPSDEFLTSGVLEITFNGSIQLSMGDYIFETYNSDGKNSLWFSTYYLNAKPTFKITAKANTEVYSLTFKASKN